MSLPSKSVAYLSCIRFPVAHYNTPIAAPSIQLSQLPGAWRRRWLRRPGQPQDTTTQVHWIQATTHYADIRISPNAPDFSNVRSLPDCSPEQLDYLATQQGFAGTLIQTPQGFHWLRELDLQPPNGQRDIGRLNFLDPAQHLLEEQGVEAPYTELWERAGPPANPQPPLVMKLKESAPARGYLILANNHLLLAIDRRPQSLVTPSNSLQELMFHLPPQDCWQLLDMELSLCRNPGPSNLWPIEQSTHPWRRGQPIFPLHPSHHWHVLEGDSASISNLP